MLRVDLREHEPSDHPLTAGQLAALHGYRTELDLAVEPAAAADGHWRLTPGSTVGALEIGDVLSVSIQPKLDIERVLFLASYALGEFNLRDLEKFKFPETTKPVEALVRLFLAAARRAFSRGLLRGYRTEEEALYTVRGRIRFADQLRRRFSVPLPVEVRYDEFTEDVLPNRLVRAAVHALGTLRLLDAASRQGLAQIAATLENVALREFPPHSVPEVAFDRLNEHYREVVGLARLILRHGTVETGRGGVRAAGFLMDMNRVFEGFVRRALREALGLTERAFPAGKNVRFDKNDKVWLKPDLSWWEGGACRFVGDAKYKRIDLRQAPNADLYQILAYTTALDLPVGMLIYAKGEADPTIHHVRNADKRIVVEALDLSGSPAAILQQINNLADRVRRLAGVPTTAAA